MSAIVIYDTNYGNTRKIAEAVADALGARAISVSDVQPEDLSGIGLLVVGSPILGWKPSERMLTFLGSLGPGRLNNVQAAAFDTRVKLFIHGDAAGKIAKALAGAGARLVTEPKAFYVKGKEGPLLEGELEKAREWGRLVKTQAARA